MQKAESKRLADCFHSVYDDETVIFTEEAARILSRHGIEFRRQGSLVIVNINELEPVLTEELRRKIEEDKRKLRLLLGSTPNATPNAQMNVQMEQTRALGPHQSPNEYLNVHLDSSASNSVSRVPLGYSFGHLKKHLGSVQIVLDGKEIEDIIKQMRCKRRVTVTIYVNPEIWARFTRSVVQVFGEPKKRSEVLEKLMLVFIEKTKQLLEGGVG